jgi:hypothetical protein
VIVRAAIFIALVVLGTAATACPMCKDAITTSAATTSAASPATGFFYSIVLMVSTPLLLMTGLTCAIIRERRLA